MPRKKKEIVPDDPFNYAGLISFLCVAALIYFSITKTGPVGLFINNLLSYLFGNYLDSMDEFSIKIFLDRK